MGAKDRPNNTLQTAGGQLGIQLSSDSSRPPAAAERER